MIHYDDNTIQYKELSAKRLVFCAGYYMAQSRYFQHVEFQNVKGETLTFERPEVEFDVVIQKTMGCAVSIRTLSSRRDI